MSSNNCKISANLRRKLRHIVRDNKISSLDRYYPLIGCTLLEFKCWISSQFSADMSWNNYGYDTWHLEHSQPCCTFDLKKKSEQLKCFHYTNLRPLNSTENFKRPKAKRHYTSHSQTS